MTQNIVDTPVPSLVQQAAGQFMILENIPSNYFLPHASLLPKESIRFFYLDQNWINALIDGMYSIGRVSDLGLNQDKQYFKDLQNAAWQWVQNSRPESSGARSSDPITGFLLHSTVVQEYPSMQVHAYLGGDSTAPTDEVPLLRLDHLTNDTLIGLFSGEFKFLAISKPPEMLHFGFEQTGINPVNQYANPTLYLNLRSLTPPNQGTETGRCVGWGMDANRRISASQLANCLKVSVSTTEMTSAEFALEMVGGATSVVFINKMSGGHE